jgi:hypothetical protein
MVMTMAMVMVMVMVIVIIIVILIVMDDWEFEKLNEICDEICYEKTFDFYFRLNIGKLHLTVTNCRAEATILSIFCLQI